MTEESPGGNPGGHGEPDHLLRLVIVVGAARSGTSLTAGLLERAGFFCGHVVGPSDENPRGYFEHVFIREHIEKAHIAAAGYDPTTQLVPPPIEFKIPRLRESVLEAFRADGWDGERPVLYKSCKLHYYWPAWVQAFPDAFFVVVRRSAAQIVESCERAHFMSLRHGAASWADWLNPQLARLHDLANHMAATEVWPQRFRFGDFGQLPAIVRAAGLPWSQEAAAAFFEPNLWHEGDDANH